MCERIEPITNYRRGIFNGSYENISQGRLCYGHVETSAYHDTEGQQRGTTEIRKRVERREFDRTIVHLFEIEPKIQTLLQEIFKEKSEKESGMIYINARRNDSQVFVECKLCENLSLILIY